MKGREDLHLGGAALAGAGDHGAERRKVHDNVIGSGCCRVVVDAPRLMLTGRCRAAGARAPVVAVSVIGFPVCFASVVASPALRLRDCAG